MKLSGVSVKNLGDVQILPAQGVRRRAQRRVVLRAFKGAEADSDVLLAVII